MTLQSLLKFSHVQRILGARLSSLLAFIAVSCVTSASLAEERDPARSSHEPGLNRPPPTNSVLTPESAGAVQALFLPHTLGDTLEDDWKWEGLSLQPEHFVVLLEHLEKPSIQIEFHKHDGASRNFQRTPSFAYQLLVPPGVSDRAARTLLDAVLENDDGSFWPSPEEPARATLIPLLGLVLLALLLDRILFKAAKPSPRAPRMGFPPPIAWALGSGLGLLLWWGASEPPVTNDSLRDVFLAVDCALEESCIGATASFRSMSQGAGWVRVLAATVDPAASDFRPIDIARRGHLLALLCYALAIVVFFSEARRWLPRRSVLATTLLASVLLPAVAEYPTLHNPTLAPLPLVVFFAGVGLLAAEGRSRWAVLAGFALAALLETHPFAAVLGLPLLFVAATSSNRPLTATVLVAGIPFTSFALVSPAATAANQYVLSHLSRSALVFLLLVALAAIVSGIALRKRQARLSVEQRAGLAIIGVSLAGLAIPLALSLGSGRELSPRYLPAMAVGLPAFIAPLLARESTGLLRATIIGLSAFLLVSLVRDTRERTTISFREVDVLAEAFEADHETWESITSRLTSPENRVYQSFLATAMNLADSGPRRTDSFRLLVGKNFLPSILTELPRGWRQISVTDTTTALYSRIDHWLDTTEWTVCVRPAASIDRPATPPECTPASLSRRNAGLDPSVQYGAMSFPPLLGLDELGSRLGLGREEPIDVQHRLTIRPRPPGNGPLRHIQVLPTERADWAIVSVNGVNFTGSLPSREVTLNQETPGPGELVIEMIEGRMDTSNLTAPVVYETTPDEGAIRSLLRNRRAGGLLLLPE